MLDLILNFCRRDRLDELAPIFDGPVGPKKWASLAGFLYGYTIGYKKVLIKVFWTLNFPQVGQLAVCEALPLAMKTPGTTRFSKRIFEQESLNLV